MIELKRFAHTPFGTFGRMAFEDGSSLYTCEDRWLDNVPLQSCIPPSPGSFDVEYVLHRDRTGKFQNYRFADVPGRSAIEIHVGNTELDTAGCILVGIGLGWYKERWSITDSTNAIRSLHDKLGDRTHQIRISWSFAA